MKWEKNDNHNAIIVAAGIATGMLFVWVVIFVQWMWLDYVISPLGWALLLLLIVMTGLCITVALGYVTQVPPSHIRVPTYAHPHFSKSKKEVIDRETVHVQTCSATYEKITSDKATNMVIEDIEVTAVGRTPEDVERLLKFARKEMEEGCDA